MKKYILVSSIMMIARVAGADLAGSITAKSVSDPNAVQYSASNDSRGREKKAENAQDTGKQGNAAAMVTGSLLTAAGVPMVASPILSVQIAGANLLAKATLEFAQAGADKKNSGTNGAQKDLLLNKQGQEVSQATGGTAPNKSVLTPQLDKLLTDRGVNSQDFVNRLTSGELTDPTEILKAMGADVSQVTDAALAEGASMANAQLSNSLKTAAEKLGSEPTRKIDYDAKNTAKAAADDTSSAGSGSVSGGVSSGGAPGGGVGAASATGAAGALPSAASASAAAGKAAGPITQLSSEAQVSTLANAAANSLLALQGAGFSLDPSEASVLDAFGPHAAAGALNNPAVAQVFLDRVGIQKLSGKQNIFQTAHRNFRNYGKWRKETKVAARKLP